MATTLARTYQETLDLMIEARNYLSYRHPRERGAADVDARLKMSCEAFRITSRLAQVMAWLMAQRAVHSGEMSAERAALEFGLSAADVCLDASCHDDGELPHGLRALMGRSHDLYVRVSRLDGMLRDRLN